MTHFLAVLLALVLLAVTLQDAFEVMLGSVKNLGRYAASWIAG